VTACAAWDTVGILAHRGGNTAALPDDCAKLRASHEMTISLKNPVPVLSWYFIPLRVLLVTVIVSLLSFAVSLFLGICAVMSAAKLHNIHPDLRIAYRFIAAPAAGVVAMIVLISASFMEIRHYRRSRVLRHIEHQIGRSA
jgi:hypothetical protein